MTLFKQDLRNLNSLGTTAFFNHTYLILYGYGFGYKPVVADEFKMAA